MTAAPAEKTRRRWPSALAAAASSALILALLFRLLDIDPASLWDAWQQASPGLLVLAAVFSLGVHVATSTDKLFRVMRAAGLSITWGEVLRIRLGSGPIRLLLPVDAGDVANILFFHRGRNMPIDSASGAIVFDRGLNLIGSTFWLLAGLALLQAESPAPRALLFGAIGVAYAVFLYAGSIHRLVIRTAEAFHPRLGRFARGSLSLFQKLNARQKAFFCLYGILFQARPLVVAWLLFAAFGLQPPVGEFIAWIVLALFAGHLPTAMGMGPREAAVVMLFAGIAPPAILLGIGLLLTLFVHALPMAVGLPWVYWYLHKIANGTRG
ncbi:MAG: flippase-like domain-containing protein [Deltaproteobacteria bacterium]|nr:flippase-like domain-containing protein [Deltaproteobacteria bacterium]